MKKLLTLALALCLVLSMVAVPAMAEEKVVLELWHYFGTDYENSDGSVFLRDVARYNEMQDKVQINASYVAREDLLKQYTMGALSGELPDIGMIDNPDMASYIQMGVFADITDQLNAWGQLDQFFVGPLNSCTQEGRIYGLPHNSNCLTLFYDKDMLAAAGVEVPTNWTELREAAKALSDPAQNRYGLAISAVKNEEGCFQFMPWFISAGGKLEELNGEGCVEAMDYLNTLIQDGSMAKDIINFTQGDANNQFISGNAAMQVNGPWNVASILELAPEKNWGVALMPKADDGVYASVLGGENFGPTVGCKDLDAAVEFLTWLMSKEVSADFCEVGGKFSPRADSTESKEIWTTDPVFSVFAEMMQYAMPRGPHPRWPEISTAISVAEHEVFTGSKDAQSALDAAAATVSAILG
ncbi:sugar ABC transporter substrate-binding protein [Eubacteriales bacterium OttesenSCG-928-N13]|nr:sugar ABC transporter substrate-binding protein [Eubacteriales bacterium OttesenSCG-928-N13]